MTGAARVALGPELPVLFANDERLAELAGGAKTLIIGIAPAGGSLPESWIAQLVEALEAGLDVASGRKQARNEVNGFREITIWKQGVTL